MMYLNRYLLLHEVMIVALSFLLDYEKLEQENDSDESSDEEEPTRQPYVVVSKEAIYKEQRGQTKPVHVYRLATALSFEGRMLKRAFSKLRLEHVEEDMLALLRDDDNPEDKMVQTNISDEDLEKVLDRSDLIASGPAKADGKPNYVTSTLPLKGPCWEVVIPTATGGMLSTVNN
ncbi:putative DNA helicase [Helianthus annuus]|nr:putative DNA helicase [Helianthus annuus]